MRTATASATSAGGRVPDRYRSSEPEDSREHVFIGDAAQVGGGVDLEPFLHDDAGSNRVVDLGVPRRERVVGGKERETVREVGEDPGVVIAEHARADGEGHRPHAEDVLASEMELVRVLDGEVGVRVEDGQDVDAGLEPV